MVTISIESIWIYNNCLVFVNNITKFCTFILYRPCIFLLASPPASLSYHEKQQLNKLQKSFLDENKHNPQKPTKLDGNDTTILSHHPYILPTMHTTKLSTCTLAYSHPLKRNACVHTNKALSTAHQVNSLPHARQPYVPCMFSSTKSSQHNWHSNIPYTDSTLLMHSTASAYKTDHICHAESVVTHNMTSPCTSTCATLPCSTTHSTGFHPGFHPYVCFVFVQKTVLWLFSSVLGEGLFSSVLGKGLLGIKAVMCSCFNS